MPKYLINKDMRINTMANIAFLGTGAMGARMALNLIKAGLSLIHI